LAQKLLAACLPSLARLCWSKHAQRVTAAAAALTVSNSSNSSNSSNISSSWSYGTMTQSLDDSSSTDAGEAADLYDLNSLEAGHSVHNGPTTAAVAAAAPVNSSSAALPAPPPALHRLGSSMRSAVSDVSRADSEQLAELREGGDVLAALQCPTANADKSSSARVKQQFSAFHAGHAAAAAVADQEGAVLKHSTVGRGQGGQLAAAAAALAAARRNAGSTTAAATAAGGGAGGDSGDPQDEVSAMLYGLQ
jgi:hypothetical protein